MTPYYEDSWLTVYGGDCREVMRSMEPESVHCVVTSPPYWGLRDYGTATWDGGDPACDHAPAPLNPDRDAPGRRHSTIGQGPSNMAARGQFASECRKCGARRIDNQLGLEATPEEYVASMVDVFREVRRVLRADGTVWLNLGDSYATSGTRQGNRGETLGSERLDDHRQFYVSTPAGLKNKDLVGIPWRVAFALQADGWYLRSDIIWSKPNPMPESVTDRPTKSHEYLFLLSKSPRYYFDADAVAESAVTDGSLNGGAYSPPGQLPHGNARPSKKRGEFSGKTEAMPGRNAFRAVVTRRNIRSVWTIATQPYPGAHFATFPRKLVEPCIKAGTPDGGIILDPFAGSGTTGMVAQSLGRRAVLIDLNPDYLAQAMLRNRDIPLGLEVA